MTELGSLGRHPLSAIIKILLYDVFIYRCNNINNDYYCYIVQLCSTVIPVITKYRLSRSSATHAFCLVSHNYRPLSFIHQAYYVLDFICLTISKPWVDGNIFLKNESCKVQ